MPFEFLNQREKRIIELKVRKNIFNFIRNSPGSHFREIERRTHLQTGVLQYHISYFIKNGLIKQINNGKKTRYFSKDFNFDNKELISLLRQERIRHILLFILEKNICTNESISNYLSLSPSTISWYLKKLEESGIISSIKKGRNINYYLLSKKEDIIALLISYQESFLDLLVDRTIEMWNIKKGK